jgi:hypothetical protein
MKLAILFLFLTTSWIKYANCQVLFTDFNPNINLFVYNDSTVSQYFDLNQDGIEDFRIRLSSRYTGSYGPTNIYDKDVYILPIDSNSKIGWTDTTNLGFACNHLTVESGMLVSNRLFFWKEIGAIAKVYPGGSHVCDQGGQKKYIPLKLHFDGSYHFGWIGFQELTFFDMAVNLSPNQPVIAGSSDEVNLETFKKIPFDLFPTITIDKIKIIGNEFENEKYSLYSSSGQLLMIFYTNIDGKYQLDVSELFGGIYFLRNENTGMCKKIVKVEQQEK